jgi:hypothetical protein
LDRARNIAVSASFVKERSACAAVELVDRRVVACRPIGITSRTMNIIDGHHFDSRPIGTSRDTEVDHECGLRGGRDMRSDLVDARLHTGSCNVYHVARRHVQTTAANTGQEQCEVPHHVLRWVHGDVQKRTKRCQHDIHLTAAHVATGTKQADIVRTTDIRAIRNNTEFPLQWQAGSARPSSKDTSSTQPHLLVDIPCFAQKFYSDQQLQPMYKIQLPVLAEVQSFDDSGITTIALSFI